MVDAWAQVTAWLDAEVTWIPQPAERHRDVLQSLVAEPGMQANLVPDAHLALAIAEEVDLEGDKPQRVGRIAWRDGQLGTACDLVRRSRAMLDASTSRD